MSDITLLYREIVAKTNGISGLESRAPVKRLNKSLQMKSKLFLDLTSFHDLMNEIIAYLATGKSLFSLSDKIAKVAHHNPPLEISIQDVENWYSSLLLNNAFQIKMNQHLATIQASLLPDPFNDLDSIYATQSSNPVKNLDESLMHAIDSCIKSKWVLIDQTWHSLQSMRLRKMSILSPSFASQSTPSFEASKSNEWNGSLENNSNNNNTQTCKGTTFQQDQDDEEMDQELLAQLEHENTIMLEQLQGTQNLVQDVTQSLHHITNLQETLSMHLSSQTEVISNINSNAETAVLDVGQGLKQLKKAEEAFGGIKWWVLYLFLVLSGTLLAFDWYYS